MGAGSVLAPVFVQGASTLMHVAIQTMSNVVMRRFQVFPVGVVLLATLGGILPRRIPVGGAP